MNNNTRKIVVLNNLKSQRIEQAIFILRDENVTNEADAVSEAQRIVEAYLAETRRPLMEKNTKNKKKGKGLFFLCGAIVVSVLLFLIIH